MQVEQPSTAKSSIGARATQPRQPAPRIPLLEREHVLAYVLLAPAVITLLVFVAYPFLYGIWLSLTNSKIGIPGHFIGLRNFRAVLDDPIFRRAVGNTFAYTAVTTVFKLVLGIAMALVLNNQFRGKRFARAAMLLPWIVPTVLSALAWKLIFDSLYSPINWMLQHRWAWSDLYQLGVALSSFVLAAYAAIYLGRWLGSSEPGKRLGPNAVLISQLVVVIALIVVWNKIVGTIFDPPGGQWQLTKRGPSWLGQNPFPMISLMIANIWRGVPFFGISLLAGLQTIPLELYEAAAIDGASARQRFQRITLPLLRPVLTVVLLLSTILTFADFQLIAVLTNGGPANSTHVFATYAYQTGIVGGGNIGVGAAISLFMFPVLMFVVFAVLLSLRKE